MSYKSPIETIVSELRIEQVKKLEGDILHAVQEIGITVDKEQLLKALQYDRHQYEMGYKDGYDDGYSHVKDWIPAEIMRPDDCGYYLVCIKDELNAIYIRTAYYSTLYGWGDIVVTHWQPLPVPPAEREGTE